VVTSSGPVTGATMKDFNMPYFYFLHITSGRSWPTDDPHRWLLDRRDDDLLAPTRERLVLSPDDPERCVRAAIRRCGLVLVRIVSESQIAVRHWTDPAPDLRAWAKEHRLARVGVAVTTEDVKHNRFVVHQDGQDLLLYGEQVGPDFPWGMYETKYAKRQVHEAGDDDPAPVAYTNFCWPGSPHERLGLRVLKSIWRAEHVACPNCDVPLVLIAFEWRMGTLSFCSARIVRHCLGCRRRFAVAEERPLAWLADVLPAPLRPTHLRLWAAIPIDWLELSLRRDRAVQTVDREG
jgi:hypothetical protein